MESDVQVDIRVIPENIYGAALQYFTGNKIHNIKTRQIGRRVWVYLYVSLPLDKTVAEVNTISEQIRQSIANRVEHLGNVNIVCE